MTYTHLNRRRTLRLLMTMTVTLIAWIATSGSARAVGVPVTIDSFGNPNLTAGPFSRTVIPLPAPHTSTTPPGTFSPSNGLATLTMSGAGNGISGSTLQYTPTSGSPVDLTGGGTNAQIFIDFALINQVPAPNDLSVPGVTTYLSATDVHGNTATSPSDGIGNVFAFNAAFPFTGFQGSIDWTQITQLDISFVYPTSGTGGGSLEVQVNKLWATPLAGAPPTPPAPTVTAPQTAAGGPGATVDFTVSFTNSEGAAPVTFDPPSNIGLRAQDLTVAGSAFGGAMPTVRVSGGPSTYTVAVSGMTQSGGITVNVPAGVVDDAWAQLNTASSNDPTVAYIYGIPPQFKSPAAATFTVGAPSSSVTVDATGGTPPPTPTPTLSIASGTLPSGLSFKDNGDGTATISGSPAAGTGGTAPLTLKASSPAGTVTQAFVLTIDQAPSITSAATATFMQGSPGSFTLTTTPGFPARTTLSITAGALPSGVQFKDNGDGTATISGTPATGGAGRYPLTITAANGAGWAANQQFTLTVLAAATPPTTNPTSIRAALLKLLTPTGGQAKITAVLANRGYTASFDAPSPGSLIASWHRDGLLATGTAAYAKAGVEKLTVTLTRYGRHLLRQAHRLTLLATGTFTPSGGSPVTVSTTITLRRG